MKFDEVFDDKTRKDFRERATKEYGPIVAKGAEILVDLVGPPTNAIVNGVDKVLGLGDDKK